MRTCICDSVMPAHHGGSDENKRHVIRLPEDERETLLQVVKN